MKLMAYVTQEGDENQEVDALWFDGYLIGERRLEGLPIKVMVNHLADELVIEANWPKGMDAVYWTAQAKEFALQHDCFSTTEELDNDDGYLEMDE